MSVTGNKGWRTPQQKNASLQAVEQEEIEEFIGNKVYACDVCGLIAIADKGEDIKEVGCIECGNREWTLLGELATSVEEDEFSDEEDEEPTVEEIDESDDIDDDLNEGDELDMGGIENDIRDEYEP